MLRVKRELIYFSRDAALEERFILQLLKQDWSSGALLPYIKPRGAIVTRAYGQRHQVSMFRFGQILMKQSHEQFRVLTTRWGQI
jgi:hypothetical protein